jgi:hypothetical protein
MAVWNSLAVVVAEGLESRRKGQLICQTFASPGPNDTWSGDETVTRSWKGGDFRYMAVLMGFRDICFGFE